MTRRCNLKDGLNISEAYTEMSLTASDFLIEMIIHKPNLLLCAATGNSPKGVYAKLAIDANKNPRRYTHLCIIKLDEWGGIGGNQPASCESYIKENIIIPLAISPDRYIGFKGNTVHPKKECDRISGELARKGSIDVCILGLGINGHLALNEPGMHLTPFSHVAALDEQSRSHRMLLQSEKRVDYGLTLGMAEIFASRIIIFLVSGEEKREPFSRFMGKKVSTDFPASLLWLHPEVYCFCDRAALSG